MEKRRITKKSKQGPTGSGKTLTALVRRPYLWLYLLLLLVILVSYLSNRYRPEEIAWLEFERNLLKKNLIEKIVVVNQSKAHIYIRETEPEDPTRKDLPTSLLKGSPGPQYVMELGSMESFEMKLEEAQKETPEQFRIDLQYVNQSNWPEILTWILPVLFIFVLWMALLRRIVGRGSTGSPFNFTKTTAKLTTKETRSSVTFADVAGLREAKTEIMEIVDFLKNPENYTRLGAKIPKGILLIGPPGTGKTLLARAVAGEAEVPFFSLSGSEFVEMFVGVGASRVRDLFRQAKEHAPSIIFIDEIDAVGRARNRGNFFQSNDERENTLNQLLAELDGFGVNTGVIVLAATNRADILDKALLRPGFSGADIANICNEAALIAARKNKKQVDQSDFIKARDRVVGGLERKNRITSSREKEIIAYHEAGHAVASWFLKHVDSLLKVSIIPRGKTLGSAWYLPEERQIITKKQFLDQICAALGGRVAEEIVFGDVSSGALDDLEKVTKQAYSMVAYFGLDEEIGPISYYDSTGRNEQLLVKPYSEHLAQKIDEEVHALITEAYERTKALLLEHRDEMEGLTRLLIRKEVGEKEELEEILGKRNNKAFAESADASG